MLGIRHFRGTAVDLYQGDITDFACDVMVTAANPELRGGGGVDGAIHAAAGPQLMAECRNVGACPTGSAVITGAGQLPCRHVIHAVGPRWPEGVVTRDEGARLGALLTNAYQRSLDLAVQYGQRHIVFPAISAGTYQFPLPAAAEVAMKAVRTFLEANPSRALRVTFALRSAEVYRHFQTALFATFPEGES